MAQYIVGQVVRLGVTFTSAATGTATDPTVVTFSYRPPSGGEVSEVYDVDADVQKTGTGVYVRDLTLNEPGTWHYRWEGSGDVTTANEDSVGVKASLFA